MNSRLLPAMVIVAALTAAAGAQDSGSAPPASQNPGQNSGQGSGGGYGQHGGRGSYGGGMGMWSRGMIGTVTEVAADHYTIKTDAGEVYTVHFTSDTRIVKQVAGMRGPGGGGMGEHGGQRMAGGGGGPQPIKPTDIKVGDAIGVMGDIDATAKSVGALRIVHSALKL